MSAFTNNPHTTFDNALHYLKAGGYHAYRSGWNGKGLTVHLQRPDENSKMTHPYFYIVHNEGKDGEQDGRVPWVPSQTDLLAEDWVIINENSKTEEEE